MTMITAVGPRGDCPRWKAFLHRITGGDEALIAYLQRVAGYCLTADTGEQAMFFGYGVGANGKGVFLHTIGRVLGDYCKTAAIETFTETKCDRHPTELARLHSARLVVATETEKRPTLGRGAHQDADGRRRRHRAFHAAWTTLNTCRGSSCSFPATTSRACAASARRCGGGST